MERSISKLYDALRMYGMESRWIESHSYPSFLRLFPSVSVDDHETNFTFHFNAKFSALGSKSLPIDESFISDFMYILHDLPCEFSGVLIVNQKILYEFPFVNDKFHERWIAQVYNLTILSGSQNNAIVLKTHCRTIDAMTIKPPSLYLLGLRVFHILQ